MKYLIGIVVTALVIVLATFGIQNPFPITVRFMQLQSAAVPLYLVILLAAVIGILVSALLSVPGRIQQRLELRRLRHQLTEQAQQLIDLKARIPAPVMQPLPDELHR
jgi:uncharacterized integral membrane protein